MFWPMTGCSGDVPPFIQLSQQDPRLQEVVPTAYAVIPPTLP